MRCSTARPAPAEVRELDTLLAGDSAARAEFEDLRQLFDGLAQIPKVYPPEGLVASVMAAVTVPPAPEAGADQLFSLSRVIGETSEETRASIPGKSATVPQGFQPGPYIRGKQMNEEQRGSFGKRKAWIGAGIAAVAAVVAVSFVDYPPTGKDTTGTIVPAQRYQAPQMTAGDVKVGAPSATQAGQPGAIGNAGVAGRDGLDASRNALDASRSALDASRSALDASRSALDGVNRSALDGANRSALDASRNALDGSRSALDASRSALDGANRNALDASRSALDASRSALDGVNRSALDGASRNALDASRSALDASRSALDASRNALDASRNALDGANRNALDASRNALDASRSALDGASRNAADGASRNALDASRNALDASRSALDGASRNATRRPAQRGRRPAQRGRRRSATRSTGSATRSTGSATRSTGSATRSTGSATRSTGSATPHPTDRRRLGPCPTQLGHIGIPPALEPAVCIWAPPPYAPGGHYAFGEGDVRNRLLCVLLACMPAVAAADASPVGISQMFTKDLRLYYYDYLSDLAPLRGAHVHELACMAAAVHGLDTVRADDRTVAGCRGLRQRPHVRRRRTTCWSSTWRRFRTRSRRFRRASACTS